VLGPTASGKSEVALRLAERLGGEIVVADSRQVYRELEIATNKPLPEQLRRARYHCVGVADPRRPFNVHDYVELARPAVEAIAGRGRLPIVEGATMLYVDALLDGLSLAGVPPDRERRAELAGWSLEALGARVRELDPEAELDWRNPVRLVRAIEVLEAAGPPLARRRTRRPPPWRQLRVGLEVPRDELARRIRARSEEQLQRGLVEETRQALARGVGRDSQVLTGTGYVEAVALLEGRVRQEELLELMVRGNLRLARRQMTWMRRDRRIHWVPAAGDPVPAILDYLAGKLG
jgi:tRNA dimethylallyltransferase